MKTKTAYNVLMREDGGLVQTLGTHLSWGSALCDLEQRVETVKSVLEDEDVDFIRIDNYAEYVTFLDKGIDVDSQIGGFEPGLYILPPRNTDASMKLFYKPQSGFFKHEHIELWIQKDTFCITYGETDVHEAMEQVWQRLGQTLLMLETDKYLTCWSDEKDYKITIAKFDKWLIYKLSHYDNFYLYSPEVGGDKDDIATVLASFENKYGEKYERMCETGDVLVCGKKGGDAPTLYIVLPKLPKED